MEHHQFLGVGRTTEQPSLTGSEVVTPRGLVLIFIEKGRFAKEEVRAVCQCSDTSSILRAVKGINHIGNLLPGRFLHQAIAQLAQREIPTLLMSVFMSPASRDNPLVGLAT